MSLLRHPASDSTMAPLLSACLAESMGTFILVLFGIGFCSRSGIHWSASRIVAGGCRMGIRSYSSDLRKRRGFWSAPQTQR